MSKQKGYQITFLDIFIVVSQCTASVRDVDVLKRSSEVIFSFAIEFFGAT